MAEMEAEYMTDNKLDAITDAWRTKSQANLAKNLAWLAVLFFMFCLMAEPLLKVLEQ